MNTEILVGDRKIGAGHPVFMVAEISANHNGSFERAAAIVRAAKAAGADAVKLQTYTADTMTIDCDAPRFRIGGGTLWDGQTLHELYRRASTPWEWQPELKRLADELGLVLFSSPFDASAVEFLEKMAVPAHKIASLELVDDELLAAVARTKKPVFLATGLADAGEIEHALEVLDKNGSGGVVLLHCLSAYPAETDAMHIRTIPDMAARFRRPVGLSDHSASHTAALGAVALGACVVEKHCTGSRADGGPDAAFSLEPAELRELVRAVRDMEAALGTARYGALPGEEPSRVFRRSLSAVADIREGEPFTRDNVRSIRPEGGLAPRHLAALLGRRAARAIGRGEPITWDAVAGEV